MADINPKASPDDVRSLRLFATWAAQTGDVECLPLAGLAEPLLRLLADYDRMRSAVRPEQEPDEPSPAVEKRRRWRKARSTAVLGRVCLGCGRSDSEANWSTTTALCSSCAVARSANGACHCGSPLWKGRRGGVLHCRAGCGGAT